MTAMLCEPVALVLTADEYEALPPNSRVELVDGVVHAMTPATGRHQAVVDNLRRLVAACCPEDLRIVREQEIFLGKLHRRNPDVLAIHAHAFDLDRYSYRPDEVLLAAEVVSPGTETTDRKHKPAEYADAGIQHYWRIETRPKLVVHTYLLGETGHYLETGLFRVGDTTAVAGLPWAKIVVADLAP